MRVIVEPKNEDAVERVRRKAGDRSATETVNRLIEEADAGPAQCKQSLPCVLPDGHVGLCKLGAMRTRKGAK